MRDLTIEERNELELIKKKAYENVKNGYVFYTINCISNNKRTKKNYKKSRILLQLHLNKKLDPWELVHHIDENRRNDSLDNLKIMSMEDHISHHHAGVRRNKH